MTKATTSAGASGIADILDRAADLIEPKGAWVKGVMALNAEGQSVSGIQQRLTEAVCFCAFAALEHVLGDHPHMHPATNFFCDFIGTSAVGKWNDAPGRTQAEVVAKLRQAAARAREAGQ